MQFSFFKEDEPFEINAENVSVFVNEEATYYIKHAPKDISFELSTTKNIADIPYTLVNAEDEEVAAEIKETDAQSYELSPAKSSYTAGARYTLTLGPDVQFVNEYLADAESVVFAIGRDPIEDYAFTDAVTEVDETIIEVNEETIQLSDFQGEPGDLVFGINEQDSEVIYKIVEAQGEDAFQVELPALDEIYAELELSGKYALDLNNAASNPTLEAEIAQAIKESEFYSALMMKAYAEEKPDQLAIDVEIVDHSDDETLECLIELTLKPGEDGLFGDMKFQEHEVVLTLENQISASVDLNIQNISDWDVATTRKDQADWAIEVTAIVNEQEVAPSFSEALAVADAAAIKKVVDALQSIESDQAISEIKLFQHSFSVPNILGLTVQTAINLPLQFDLGTNAQTDNAYSTLSTVGLVFTDQEFKPYSYFIHENEQNEFTLHGQYDTKFGVLTAMNSQLFHDDIAHVKLQPEIGLHSKGYTALPLTQSVEEDDEIYGYLEQFLYFQAGIESQIHLLADRYEFTDDIAEQVNLVEGAFGIDQIAMGIESDVTEVQAKYGMVTSPVFSFETFDVRTGETAKETIDLANLTFTLEDGTELERKDKLVVLPVSDASEMIITASYEYSADKIFKQSFTALIPSDTIVHDAFAESMIFTFLSGAGAWRTELTLNKDGSFAGKFSDSNGFDSGPGYLSTIYISEFSGQFEAIEKIDEQTFSMNLSTISLKNEVGEEWIDDQVLYIASDPYGLTDGQQFILHAPGTAIDGLDEEFLSWYFLPYFDAPRDTLNRWGLHNINTGHGFFSEPME